MRPETGAPKLVPVRLRKPHVATNRVIEIGRNPQASAIVTDRIVICFRVNFFKEFSGRRRQLILYDLAKIGEEELLYPFDFLRDAFLIDDRP